MEQNILENRNKFYQIIQRRNIEYFIVLFFLSILTFLYSSFLDLIPIVLVSVGTSGIGYGLALVREYRRFLLPTDKKRIIQNAVESTIFSVVIITIGILSFTQYFDQLLFNGYTSLGIFIFVFSTAWGENSTRRKYLASISFEQLSIVLANTPKSLFSLIENQKK